MFDEIASFSFPTQIRFGCGAVGIVPDCLAESGVSKPLIITDADLSPFMFDLALFPLFCLLTFRLV